MYKLILSDRMIGRFTSKGEAFRYSVKYLEHKGQPVTDVRWSVRDNEWTLETASGQIFDFTAQSD